MKSQKIVVTLVAAACALGLLGAGAAYFVVGLQNKRVARELELARENVKLENYDEAQKSLGGLLERAKGTESYFPELLALQLRIERKRRQWDAAAITANRLLEPGREYEPRFTIPAHMHLGQDALDRDNAEKARFHFDEILKLSDASGLGRDVARLGLARIRMATEGVTPALRDELKALLAEFPESESREDVEFALGQCNMALLLSPLPQEGDVVHEIAKGDTLYGMARKYKVSQEAIMGLNRVTNPKTLTIGRRLKIPDVKFSLVANKTDNTLTLLNKGEFFKRYYARMARADSMLPNGDYRVDAKKPDPEWTDPATGRTIPAGEAGNELGTRWIGFGGSLGIHGVPDPATIGTCSSRAWIGLLREDVEELYDVVMTGTPVKVTGAINPSRVVEDAPSPAAAPPPGATF